MRKIGVSLSPALLLDQAKDAEKMLLAEYGGLKPLLDWLARTGVISVELRSVGADFLPGQLLAISRQLQEHSLDLTVHGALAEAVLDEVAAERFFRPYQQLLAKRGKKPLLIVLHALRDTAKMTVASLQGLVAYAEKNALAIQLALENSREKQGTLVGASCREIADIVKKTGLAQVGTCWDFGHFYYNVLNETTEGKALGHDSRAVPGVDFLTRAIHTHIHGLVAGTTHFPLEPGINLPLARYLAALEKAGYQGLYNLELGFERFSHETGPRTGLEQSILALQGI